jgi:hypothetical protein
MAKWWMRLALCAIGLGFPAMAQAQFPFGPGGGGHPGPEPLPVACEPLPLSTPVPTPGPADLPALTTQNLCIGGNQASAFGDDEHYPSGALENFGDGPGCYFGIGTRALQRGGFGHRPLAVLDPQNLDTGNPPVQGANPVVLDQHDLSTAMAWGAQATLGWRFCENLAVEATGFYLPTEVKSHTIARPGRLDMPFVNPPLGFEGDNGLWLQADRVTLLSQSTMASAELNLRCQPLSGYGLEWLFGVRYFDVHESYSIFTDDDGLTVIPVDPTRQAIYTVTTRNRICAIQMGVDWEVPLTCWLAWDAYAKVAGGVDFVDVDVGLVRGDGFGGPFGHRNTTRSAYIGEVGMFLDWYLADRVRLRTGWTAIWVVNVAVASDQIDYDLSHTVGHQNNNGNLFYQGPVVEVHFSF